MEKQHRSLVSTFPFLSAYFKTLFTCLILLPSLSAQESVSNELTLSPLFSSHAVLQNGVPVPIWGKAKPSDSVTVSFAGQTLTTTANNEGRWKVTLTPLGISKEPQKLTIKTSSKQVVLEDVLVGEVWLVCGRSNINFSVGRMLNSAEEVKKADQPNLRLLQVATKDPSLTPQDTFTSKGWTSATPETIKGFSAVGWVFGSELQKARNVPVGIVMSS